MAGIRGSTSTGLACILLAVLGLGGGLAMALFSFNTEESGPRISGVPREIIYVPPASAGSFAAGLTVGISDAAAESPGVDVARQSLAAVHSIEGGAPFDSAGTLELASVSPTFRSFKGPSTPAAMQSELGAVDSSYAWAGAPTLGSGKTEAAAGAAVLLPVPEPSTWAMMLFGAGVLVAAWRRKLRS